MLANAKIPNPTRIAPEILPTTLKDPRFNLAPSKETPPLRMNHHIAEPRTTPATINAGDARPAPLFARPRPANTAANERMVIGFVIVKNTVEE